MFDAWTKKNIFSHLPGMAAGFSAKFLFEETMAKTRQNLKISLVLSYIKKTPNLKGLRLFGLKGR